MNFQDISIYYIVLKLLKTNSDSILIQVVLHNLPAFALYVYIYICACHLFDKMPTLLRLCDGAFLPLAPPCSLFVSISQACHRRSDAWTLRRNWWLVNWCYLYLIVTNCNQWYQMRGCGWFIKCLELKEFVFLMGIILDRPVYKLQWMEKGPLF